MQTEKGIMIKPESAEKGCSYSERYVKEKRFSQDVTTSKSRQPISRAPIAMASTKRKEYEHRDETEVLGVKAKNRRVEARKPEEWKENNLRATMPTERKAPQFRMAKSYGSQGWRRGADSEFMQYRSRQDARALIGRDTPGAFAKGLERPQESLSYQRTFAPMRFREMYSPRTKTLYYQAPPRYTNSYSDFENKVDGLPPNLRGKLPPHLRKQEAPLMPRSYLNGTRTESLSNSGPPAPKVSRGMDIMVSVPAEVHRRSLPLNPPPPVRQGIKMSSPMAPKSYHHFENAPESRYRQQHPAGKAMYEQPPSNRQEYSYSKTPVAAGNAPLSDGKVLESPSSSSYLPSATTSYSAAEYPRKRNSRALEPPGIENMYKIIIFEDEAGRKIKRHQCCFCSKIFAQRSNMVVHIRVHTGEKPFACYICSRAFAQKSNLKRHMRVHMKKKNNSVKSLGAVANYQYVRGGQEH
mmetsp:Transcript_73/g.116  ORF Transcript_73/g.116 Transcript_73/m.116 type:complete len:466 (-) Transcript_73:332-1729(-)|eukprot:CAMPEP_0167747038 /NCGR_PEP_ID=MMETSP0110_2-20121227/4051_1 /TAXON_ID=629695 /ORGANISM="Gymnochlora sp., Strain CCMP2014" /LENGTH=465 /DNA_ID=CAMNT_0007631879 /DNA_START=92 /DNA_END=1489 /DNA_ORIENTATION=+